MTMSPHDAAGSLRASKRRYRRLLRKADPLQIGSLAILRNLRWPENLEALRRASRECWDRAARLHRITHPVTFIVDEAATFDQLTSQLPG